MVAPREVTHARDMTSTPGDSPCHSQTVPKTASGKIQKFVLRREIGGGQL